MLSTQHLADGQLRREQRFVRAAFGYMRDLVIVCDSEGRVILINHAMEAFCGLEPAGVLPEAASEYGEILRPDGTPIAVDEAPLNKALRGDPVQGIEVLLVAKSGQRRRMVADGERLFDTDGALLGALVVWRDITDQRDAEEQLAFAALHDSLTGLPNRALFIDRVRSALVRAPRYGWATAVLAINLDHFADVAIRFGEGSADKLLLEVAQRLEVTLRPYDIVARPVDTLARLGGDRFLLMCEDMADANAAAAVANRIETILVEPIIIGDDVVRLSAAIGITLTRDPDHDPETLILEAETAMRRSKSRGSGRHLPFAPEMRAELRARGKDEDALRKALAREEFYVAYQPKVELTSELTVGVEALLRWNHPERGLVSPLDFIPLAEESGLIVPIGAWVLAQVCRDAKRWRTSLAGGRPLMVAVNVSPRQFESGLAEAFGTIIDEAGIDPTTVFLEVTESMVMQDAELAITTLRELKALGLHISVDDFGTGFSSLAYLKRFPLDELKIDKSFVDGLGRDPEATAIVAAVMGMAHGLNLKVVAEGVETADQVTQLRALGCDEAQGFYFARPVSADDIDARLISERIASVDGYHASGSRMQQRRADQTSPRGRRRRGCPSARTFEPCLGRDGGAGGFERRGRDQGHETFPTGLCRARRQPPWDQRFRRLPHPPRGSREQAHDHRHPHRRRGARREGDGVFAGGRRLHGQAVQPPRPRESRQRRHATAHRNARAHAGIGASVSMQPRTSFIFLEVFSCST